MIERVTRFVPNLVLLSLAIASRAHAAAPPIERVILITIDTWRADAIGASGSGKVKTPNLDALAKNGLYCPSAWTSSTITAPSHASILTGTQPYRHGVRDNHGFELASSSPSLAKSLRAAGYDTAAFVSALPLARVSGLDAGFRVYDDRFDASALSFTPRSRRGAATLDAVEAWLAKAPAKYFLWVHLYEPHAPYQPPESYRKTYRAAPYYGEVAYVDELVGRLQKRLGAAGSKRALWVVCGDHGEGLGDHGEATHGLFVYEATARVPLIVSAPGSLTPRKLASARLVDLAPTVLALCGIAAPKGLDGRSLLTPPKVPPPAYVETLYPLLNFGAAPVRALSDGKTKVIDVPKREVYDLTRDPAEKQNLESKNSSDARALFTALAALPAPSARPAQTTDPKALEALRSLGYVGAGGGLSVKEKGMDPKAFAPLHAKIEKARALAEAGRWAEAKPLYEELLSSFPRSSALACELGYAEAATGGLREAEAHLRKAVDIDPANAEALLGIANLRAARGDAKGAEGVLLAMLARDANDPEANFNLGTLYYEQLKQPGKAVPYWKRFLALQPDDAEAARIRSIVEQVEADTKPKKKAR